MHFIFATRGVLHQVNTFINELSTRYLPFKRYNPETMVMEDAHLQVRVCPIQLWDVSYPKEHRDLVLSTIMGMGNGRPVRDKESWRMKALNKFLNMIAKIGGLQPVGEFKRESIIAMQPPQDLEIFSVGEKEDYWTTEDGKHVDYEHKTDLSTEGI